MSPVGFVIAFIILLAALFVHPALLLLLAALVLADVYD